MVVRILFVVGWAILKFLIFCSMLYILFSPLVMWIYIGACLLNSIIVTIKTNKVKRVYE